MERVFTFSLVVTDHWRLQRIKHTTEMWRPLKHEYHSKTLTLFVKLLDYPTSNTALISNIISAIIMGLFDRRSNKETRNKQIIMIHMIL